MLIGEVTELTGVAAGRIRYYGKIGLLKTRHLVNGYRTFTPADVVDLLKIDLLRSVGLGIDAIRSVIDDSQGLTDVLTEHRAMLCAERDRLDLMIASADRALRVSSSEDASSATDVDALRRLATTHRDSLGVVGRLAVPLSPSSGNRYQRLLDDWGLPVPPVFGQMVLPARVTHFLESLAATPGSDELFERLRVLTDDIVQLLGAGSQAADDLAARWVDTQLRDPLPAPVIAVLDAAHAELTATAVIAFGYTAFVASIGAEPLCFVDAVERHVLRRGARALTVIVWPGDASV